MIVLDASAAVQACLAAGGFDLGGGIQDLADLVGGRHLAPRIVQELLQPERDPRRVDAGVELHETGRAGEWTKSVAVGFTGAFEILSIDTAQKRIGVALVDEGSSRAAELCDDAARPDAEPTASPGSLGDSLRVALKGR